MPTRGEEKNRLKDAELKKKQDYVEDAASFQKVFNCTDGDKVVKRLKRLMRPFDRDPYQNAYNTGVRETIEFILRMADEDEFKRHLEAINAQSKKQ